MRLKDGGAVATLTFVKTFGEKEESQRDYSPVAHVAKALRTQYETLRKAALAGVPLVRAYADRHACEKCRALDGKELEVAMLLETFASGSVAFPHEMPSDDCAFWCNGPTLIAS